MKGFLNIERVIFEEVQIRKAYDFLRYAGTKRVEGVALFAGVRSGMDFRLQEVVIPKQTGYILESGLMYAVDSEELRRLNVWLYNNDIELIAQIHSHPSEAYHSEADDRYPIVDTYGALSIVVPDFAAAPMNVSSWAFYRLSSSKEWDLLSSVDRERLIEIR